VVVGGGGGGGVVGGGLVGGGVGGGGEGGGVFFVCGVGGGWGGLGGGGCGFLFFLGALVFWGTGVHPGVFLLSFVVSRSGARCCGRCPCSTDQGAPLLRSFFSGTCNNRVGDFLKRKTIPSSIEGNSKCDRACGKTVGGEKSAGS